MPDSHETSAEHAAHAGPENRSEEDLGDLALEAAALAETLMQAAAAAPRRAAQRRRERLMATLVGDEAARRLVFHLTDRVLRCPDPAVAARQLRAVLAADGVPPGLPATDRLALRLAGWSAGWSPALVMPMVQARLRRASRPVVIDPDHGGLRRHLRRRASQGIVSNINVLGEAILGEAEAADRLAVIEQTLARPDVRYISVKLSAVAANVSVLAFEDTVARLAERLEAVLRAAAAQTPPVFVNVDMEEYRDLALTVAAFRTALGQPGLRSLQAGIVLQAYLPDALGALEDLIGFAAARQHEGGAPIKVRLVKGANLAMERVEAELAGWSPAPYDTKAEVDANYKRLVERALRPEHGEALRVGVGSHNLFDVCFALVLAARRGVADRLDIEMLEGMANAQVDAVADRAPAMVLYTPIARAADFSSALAYLARRLEENTAPQNYLAQLHRLATDDRLRQRERQRFLDAVRDRDQPTTAPRRQLIRAPEAGSSEAEQAPFPPFSPFANAPDTDFTAAANRTWLRRALAEHGPIPLSPPPKDLGEVDAAVARSRRAAQRWASSAGAERRDLLGRVASLMEARRGATVAAMVREAAKVATEADTEVSEAVDFARYYAERAVELDDPPPGLRHIPYGVVAVVSPWNFPYAIPAGGVLAALAAGNAVILKPAPLTAALGVRLVRQLHAAGVEPDLVQVLHTPEDDRGRRLITHPDVAAVVLTGSATTAELFTRWRPDLRLHAETSGKNAIVVTATADVDLAVRDLVRSAFGHSGQKCSATSLVIVERPLLGRAGPAQSPFLRQLRDAASSLVVGPSEEPGTMMGPLIDPPGEDLSRALRTLDPGESWLVEPRPHTPGVRVDQCRLWGPGVRLGVRPGSWFHHTECFGPVLGVMVADSLEQATAWQNQVAFGLTGGLHSLSEDEIRWWVEHVQVGNAYVNRSTTGAVVNRQPFGGWKRSVVGPGAKAGGPNYVASLGRWEEHHNTGATPEPAASRAPLIEDALRRMTRALPEWAGALESTANSYRYWWSLHFAQEHDPSALRAERNRFRYRGLGGPCLLRVEQPGFDLARALLAASVSGTGVIVSSPFSPPGWLEAGRDAVLDLVVESVDELAARLGSEDSEPVARVRVLGGATPELHGAARRNAIAVLEDPVVSHGRIELLRWVREQTVSESRHRYGNPW